MKGGKKQLYKALISTICKSLQFLVAFRGAMVMPKKNKRMAPYRTAKKPNRPAKRKQWSEKEMTDALESVTSGQAISINRAAADHGVPPSTLKNRLSGRVIHGTKPGPRPYLDTKEEKELETYLLYASKVGYGKTRRQVKAIAENVAVDKKVLRSAMGGGEDSLNGIHYSPFDSVMLQDTFA